MCCFGLGKVNFCASSCAVVCVCVTAVQGSPSSRACSALTSPHPSRGTNNADEQGVTQERWHTASLAAFKEGWSLSALFLLFPFASWAQHGDGSYFINFRHTFSLTSAGKLEQSASNLVNYKIHTLNAGPQTLFSNSHCTQNLCLFKSCHPLTKYLRVLLFLSLILTLLPLLIVCSFQLQCKILPWTGEEGWLGANRHFPEVYDKWAFISLKHQQFFSVLPFMLLLL